jgi:hypothetical protein
VGFLEIYRGFTMKFRSTTGVDIHIALTTGHTAVVGVEPSFLDPIFRKEAIARGALPEGVDDVLLQSSAPAFDRAKTIADTINAMLDGGAEGDFNGDGRPSLKKLNERLGFTASREEVDKIWEAISKAD